MAIWPQKHLKNAVAAKKNNFHHSNPICMFRRNFLNILTEKKFFATKIVRFRPLKLDYLGLGVPEATTDPTTQLPPFSHKYPQTSVPTLEKSFLKIKLVYDITRAVSESSTLYWGGFDRWKNARPERQLVWISGSAPLSLHVSKK